MIVNYYELAANFELVPAEALAYFQAKGLKTTFAWQDMLGAEHDAAFTVAKMMNTDLLKTVSDKLEAALADGTTLREFKTELIPQLQKAGWWGKQDVIDPKTGNVVKAQLGSASRLETIFRTNLQSAYSVGQWQAIEDQAEDAPYLLYDAVDDHRTRPEHKAMDGTVLPVDHVWWNTHAPTNGWNCRCGVIQLDADQLEDYGLTPTQPPPHTMRKWKNPRNGKVYDVPSDLDPGWNHNAGKARTAKLNTLALEKAATLAAAQQAAYKAAEKKQAADIKAAQLKLADEQLAAATAKQDAAQAQITEHLTSKTPYLAQAIKTLQKTKAGQSMTPAQLLDAAHAKVPLLEQSANLSGFKAQSIKGKQPSAKQQAAFEALPGEAQTSMLDDIAQKDGSAQAKAELALIGEGKADKQPGLKKKILTKWSKDGTAASYSANPKALLKAIENEAAWQQSKAEKASALSGYKKKVLAGKIPTPKQKAVFNSLDSDEQAAVLAKIEQDKAAKAQKEPNSFLPDSPDPKKPKPEPAAPPAPAPKPKPKTEPDYDDDDDDDGFDPAAMEQAIDDLIDGDTDTQNLLKILQGDIQGKPSKSQVAIYKALHGEEKLQLSNWAAMTGDGLTNSKLKKLNADVGFDPNAPIAPKDADVKLAALTDEELNDPLPKLSNLTQIGEQGGSNPGGLYQDITTGTKWYIKRPKSAEQARNEVLTGKLYEAAGVDVPEMHWRNDPDGTQIYSKIIDGLEKAPAALKAGKVAGAQEHMIVDAWLANWDVVGLEFDNMLVKQGKAIRIDTGAGLLYRAQGDAKGDAWNSLVSERESLRDAKLNPQAAAVFDNVTEEQIIAGVRRVLAIDRDTLRALVREHGPADDQAQAILIDTLVQRQNALAKAYPEAAKKPKKAAKENSGKVISPALHKKIYESRVNGMTILRDQGDIEDHNVRLTYLKDPNGKPITRVTLQLTADASERVNQHLKPKIKGAAATTEVFKRDSDLGPRMIELLIGINAQAKAKATIRPKDMERWAKVKPSLDKTITDLFAIAKVDGPPQATRDAAKAAAMYLRKYRTGIEKSLKDGEGSTASTVVKGAIFKPSEIPESLSKPVVKEKNQPWSEAVGGKIKYQLGNTTNSHLVGREEHSYLPGTRNSRLRNETSTKAGREQIDFYPPSNNETMRGKIYMEIPGHGDPAGVRALAILDELGIDTTEPSKRDREELYLDQMAYSHTSKAERRVLRAPYQDITGGQAARITAKQKLISEWVGHDITANRYYKESERESRQAFGHGRAVTYRSDMKPTEVASFAKTHRLYHNPNGLSSNGTSQKTTWNKLKPVFNGGGTLTSLADRLRRGIEPGDSSASADFESGGGNYVFTRVQEMGEQGRTPHTGLFFKADRLARRTDAVSYDTDHFGNVQDEYLGYRQNTIEEMSNPKKSNNEMIFKDGLSLFEELDVIVLLNKAERAEAIADLKAWGYKKWPDGRALTEVIKYRGQD